MPINFWVAVINDEVHAFANTSQFRSKAAYNSSAEVTIYAQHNTQHRGFGKALYNQLLQALRHSGLHRLYAVIALPNETSINLHTRLGFKTVGTSDQVGTKFGRYINTAILQKQL